MAEILCAAPLIRGTEFFLDNAGARLFGTCGERALASAASSVLGRDVNPLGVYTSMLVHGWADPGGASTIGGLLNQAKQMTLPIAALQGYGEPWPDWLGWLDIWVTIAGDPVVLEVANGQALVDSISGQGENAVNLQYHYIAVLGRNQAGFSRRAGRVLPDGWWCADGDNFAGNNDNAHGFNAVNVLQFYTDEVLGVARPCAGLALRGKAIKMAWTQMTDGRGLDDKGHTCGQGMLNLITGNGWLGVDGLTSEIYPDPEGSFLCMANGAILTYDKASNQTVADEAAAMLAKVWTMYEALKNAPSAPVVPVAPPASIPQEYVLAKAAVDALKAAGAV